jgi:hypothetical protein
MLGIFYLRFARCLRAGLLGMAACLLVQPLIANAQLVSGLAGASGSTVGPDQAIYVTEGAVGRVTRVDPATGATSTLAEGLPPSIIGIGGAVDVAFIGATAYVLVTLVGPDTAVVGAPAGTDAVGIYRVDGPGSFSIVADIGAWSQAHPPQTDYFFPTGVQYAIETYRGGFLVTDGHHNRVLHVTLDGEITEFATFGNLVPTGLEVHGDTVYMNQAGPLPHEPQDGKVIAIEGRSGTVSDIASGIRLAVDVEIGRGRTLYALSQGLWDGPFDGTPAEPFTGALMRVHEDGSVTTLVTALNIPTSLEFIGNTAYVITLVGDIWVIPDVSAQPFGLARR